MGCIVDGDVVLSRPPAGPLSARIDAFAAWSREQGYTLRSRWRQVLLAACLCRWLGERALSVRRVCDEHATQFLRSRARRVQIQPDDATVLRQFLEFLRREGSIPASPLPASQNCEAADHGAPIVPALRTLPRRANHGSGGGGSRCA
jgi:hypothetical protein